MDLINVGTSYEGTAIAIRDTERDPEKILDLVASMAVHGWDGKPILLARHGDGYLALTGNHRLWACAVLQREPVAHVVAVDMDFDCCSDDDDIMTCLEEFGGDEESVRIMRAELEVHSNAEGARIAALP